MFDVDALIPLFPSEDALWIRQSTVGSWDLCPGRVGHSTHPDFNNLPSEAMSWGTLMHGILERDITGRRSVVAGGRVLDPRPPVVPLSWEQVANLWRDLVRSEYHVELEDLASAELIESGAKEALGAYQLWLDNVKPHLPGSQGEWIAERRLEAFLGWLPSGRQVWLHGTADLLAPDVARGVDWKTSGRAWKEGKADLGQHGQAASYTFLTSDDLNVTISDWDYWVYDRQKMEWVKHETHRTPQQVQAWLRHAWNVAKSIDVQAFPYTPVQSTYGKFSRGWWCSARFCGAWDICPGKHLSDDVDESEVAWTTWS